MSANKHVGPTPLTNKAIVRAIEWHEGQLRKGSGLPYIVHPMSVFAMVWKYKDSSNADILGAASVLHDTREDCDVSYTQLAEEFGETVANIVEELTNDEKGVELLGKQDYMEQEKLAKLSPYALVIKLADMLVNISDRPKEGAIRRIAHHCEFLENGGWWRELTDTHKAMLAEIRWALSKLHGVE